MTEHIVRSGLAFGFLFTAAVSFLCAAASALWAAISVPVRWARNRGARP